MGCAMGLSLGEYTALCFADAISFADGVKITKARGEAMQAAADETESGMVSVIGLNKEKVGKLCDRVSQMSGESLKISNYLSDGNYTVGGALHACELVELYAQRWF